MPLFVIIFIIKLVARNCFNIYIYILIYNHSVEISRQLITAVLGENLLFPSKIRKRFEHLLHI